VQHAELRRILLESLPAGTVRWGHKVIGLRALDEGRHEVSFADGTTATTNLLVGADGAWSRVRPLLTDPTPEYFGTSFVETYLYDADTRHPAAAKVVGGGRCSRSTSRGSRSTLTGRAAGPCAPTWSCPSHWTGSPASTHRSRRGHRADCAGVRRLAPEITAPTTHCRSDCAGTGRRD
jgi:2-polyprenyl-6-methoxyphenol hydroxylase-like FAD-dependent oxidoreductase